MDDVEQLKADLWRETENSKYWYKSYLKCDKELRECQKKLQEIRGPSKPAPAAMSPPMSSDSPTELMQYLETIVSSLDSLPTRLASALYCSAPSPSSPSTPPSSLEKLAPSEGGRMLRGSFHGQHLTLWWNAHERAWIHEGLAWRAYPSPTSTSRSDVP